MTHRTSSTPDAASSDARRSGPAVFPMAVIEVGTSAIRMAIGETDGVSSVRMLEQLVRGVSLGKDTFTRREIRRDTLLQCVDVLKSYRRVPVHQSSAHSRCRHQRRA